MYHVFMDDMCNTDKVNCTPDAEGGVEMMKKRRGDGRGWWPFFNFVHFFRNMILHPRDTWSMLMLSSNNYFEAALGLWTNCYNDDFKPKKSPPPP